MNLPPSPAPPGAAVAIAPGIRRIIAPNPSPMTYWGTNTYLLGTRSLVVIDPGPDIPEHLAAIRAAIGDAHVTAILVTHSHVDHSPLAVSLARHTGAPVMAYGHATAGRSAVMQQLAADGLTGGGEGLDADFRPDEVLADGDAIETELGPLTALWTPGHMGNHLSFALQDAVFTGDLVMDWASSMVSPPDGDLTQFMTSCERLLTRDDRVFHPGHGPPVTDPAGRLRWLIAHRQSRTDQILAALADAPATPRALTRRIYHDVQPSLLPAAERNVIAHLVDLHEKSRVTATPGLTLDATFALA